MSLHPKNNERATKARGVVKSSSNLAPEDPKAESSHWVRKIVRCFFRKWLLTFLLVAVLVIAGFYLTQPRFYHILVIGSDQRTTEHARSDVLMILSIPKVKGEPMSIVTIPRDTKIDHPEKGLQKITHFYAMWDDTTDRLGNAPLTTQVVEDLFDIHIDGTVEFTFDSFTDIVDLVGGVQTDQGYMDGTDAQELVHNRFVQPDGDFGRTAEQRDIFKDVFAKAKNPLTAQKIYNYLLTSDRARLTVSKPSLFSFGAAYVMGHQGLSVPDLEEVVLEGAGTRIYTPSFGKSLYYWIVDEANLAEIRDKYLN